MKNIFTTLLFFIFTSPLLFAQPTQTPPAGMRWVKVTMDVVNNGASGYTSNASINRTPGPCGTNTTCGANDTSLGWSSLCNTVPPTTVGAEGTVYVQKQIFGNTGTADNTLVNLSLTCNPASGNPNWPTMTGETRRATVPHWLNPEPDNGTSINLGDQVYLPTKSELELLDDGVGNGTGTGADELRFTVIGGNGGACSSYNITARHGLLLNVSDPEFAISNDVVYPIQTITQSLSNVPDAGSGGAYNATDGSPHNSGCGGFQASALSWYFTGAGNQSGFGRGIGATSGGVGTRKLYPNMGTIKQDGSSFNVDFISNFDINLTRSSGDADARATLGPGMGGKARVVTTYDVWELQAALPITMTFFGAKYMDNSVRLNWTTASETNNDRFEIQRSANGIVWEKIGSVKGSGNSSFKNEYSYNDEKPLPSKSYYRLRQVDIDDKESFSSVKSVSKGGKNIEVFPNPIQNGKTQLFLSEPTQVRLYNVQGQLLRTWFFEAEAEAVFTLDLNDFDSGVYFLHTGDSEALRLVKN